ncbi:DNA-binding LytR/AlgR family response regulator [Bacillus thermophilus]|uniref:DNA-binding LytR/AlgR family response regulator n=1 Tax=Siminovitchia thermophila TaxID=1245522 RepID=A0ABS2R975_9BACI|nr:DNA-binding LytR/AlgR family response regulator [Siminovitchia thermophila]
MSIFILEDDVIQAQHLKRLVEEICEKHQLPHDFIEVTSKSADIIEKIPLTTFVPIYFLDIEIKSEERKGLQVAQEIREYDAPRHYCICHNAFRICADLLSIYGVCFNVY